MQSRIGCRGLTGSSEVRPFCLISELKYKIIERVNHKILKNRKNVLIVNTDNPRARAIIEMFEKGNWRILMVGPTDIPMLKHTQQLAKSQSNVPGGKQVGQSTEGQTSVNTDAQLSQGTQPTSLDLEAVKDKREPESGSTKLADLTHFQSLTEAEIREHHSILWEKYPEQLHEDVSSILTQHQIKLDAVVVFNEERVPTKVQDQPVVLPMIERENQGLGWKTSTSRDLT